MSITNKFLVCKGRCEENESFFGSEIIDNRYLQKNYDGCSIFESFYGIQDDGKLFGQFYIEIREDGFSFEKSDEIREEAIRCAQFISKSFCVEIQYIRLFFNGRDGFYLIIPNVASGLLPEYIGKYSDDLYLKYESIASFVKKEAGCPHINMDVYTIGAMHLMFETMNKETGYRCGRILMDDLKSFDSEGLNTYFRSMEKRKFSVGVKRGTRPPMGGLKAVMDEYRCQKTSDELLKEKEVFFKGYRERNVDIKRARESLQHKIDTVLEYSEMRKYFFYSYNRCCNDLKKEGDDYTRHLNHELIIPIIDFIVSVNKGRKLQIYGDGVSWYWVFDEDMDKYILKLQISQYGGADDGTFFEMCDNLKSFGEIRMPSSDFTFDTMLDVMAQIDFIMEEGEKR